MMGNFQPIETLIQSAIQDTAPAICVVVYQHGQKLVERAYGYLDPDSKHFPTLNSTLFDLASVTKLFTTTAFLMQVSAGLVQLDTPVVEIVPEFGKNGLRSIKGGQNPHTLELEPALGSGTVDPTKVTFKHLLTHTSGLAPWRDLFLNVGPIPPEPNLQDSISRTVRITKALELIAGYDFVSQLDEKINYSDLGLILLGEAVTRIDNAGTLAEVIYARVSPVVTFNPVVSRNCAPTEDDQRWRKRRCQGEVHDENAASLGGIAGHAGLFGTAESIAQLGLIWLYVLKGQVPTLSQEIAQNAVKNQGGGRGLGWVLRQEGSSSGQYFSPKSFGHTGFTGTSLWVDPERDLVVSLMTNRVYNGRDPEPITQFRRDIHDAIIQWVDTQTS